MTSIAGTVFNDANGNGRKDTGEAGLSHHYVFVDLDDDRIWDSNGVEQTSFTDSNGNYRIDDLALGKLIVRQFLFNGWKQTTPSGGYGLHVTLASGQNATGKNFGTRTISGALANRSISGKVWDDVDDDAVLDATEVGKQHVVVYVDLNKNKALDFGAEPWVESDAAGNYRIDALPSNTYSVSALFPPTYAFPGYRFSTRLPLSVAVTSGNATGKNIGVTNRPQITGRLWVDIDNDRVKDAGEAALVGWRLFIDKNKDGNLDAGETSVLTDANGFYKFKGASATSNVRIRVVKQPGYTIITPTSGYLDSGMLGFNGSFRFKQP